MVSDEAKKNYESRSPGLFSISDLKNKLQEEIQPGHLYDISFRDAFLRTSGIIELINFLNAYKMYINSIDFSYNYIDSEDDNFDAFKEAMFNFCQEDHGCKNCTINLTKNDFELDDLKDEKLSILVKSYQTEEDQIISVNCCK